MIKLKPLIPEHYEPLFPIVEREEPFIEGFTKEQLKLELARRDGFTVWDEDRLIGAITLRDLIPLLNVTVHAIIDREYHGKWANRRLLWQFFTYLFVDLDLRRASSFAFPYKTTSAAKMLTAMGFRVEGCVECGQMALDGTYHDIVLYGMLRERCPWIWTDKRKIMAWMRWRKESRIL